MACRPGKHSSKCGPVEDKPGYCACGCSAWGLNCDAQKVRHEIEKKLEDGEIGHHRAAVLLEILDEGPREPDYSEAGREISYSESGRRCPDRA